MLGAFRNITRIPELKRKLLITAALLAVCRVGVFIPVPGVDTVELGNRLSRAGGTGGGKMMAMLNLFAGGALRRASVIALGIMPYISASIIFQLLVAVVPALSKVAREGESGRKRISQWTRYSAVLICVVQSLFVANMLKGQKVAPDTLTFSFMCVVSVTAGTMLLMWVGEQIDEFGIGSGISLIIMVSIVSRMPAAIDYVYRNFNLTLGSSSGAEIGPERLVWLLGAFFLMVVAVVLVTEAQRRIPMHQARRAQTGFSQRSYLPLRVNMSGVIAIIFAQSILMVPGFLTNVSNPYVKTVMGYLSNWSYWYVIAYMGLIIFFSYFYTALTFNPLEHAENFKQYGVFIPGIRPGRRTADYIERIMNRITLPGAVFVAYVAVVPQLVANAMKVNWSVSSFFGGTSLLIIVGVALDLVQRIESYMMMQAYEGFLRGGGRIRGR